MKTTSLGQRLGVGIVLITLALTFGGFTLAAYVAVYEHHLESSAIKVREPKPPTRPEKCRPYYQDGTDRWINCMGAGKR